MGTGKSTVGKQIAARLRRPFIDTDVLIEAEAGTTIAQIFAERGEPEFRALERAVIKQVCQETESVIATGGGVMTNPDNVRLLKESGTVVCLTASPEVIFARVRGNTDRPLLQGEDPLEKIRSLLAARAEAYAKADYTIDTSQLTTDEVITTICTRLSMC